MFFSAAGTPNDVTATFNGSVITVFWTAPSDPPPAGGYLYEVFYETTTANSRLSGGTTSNTELDLTGLTLGVTYTVFVVASGLEGTPVFPSVHSNKPTIDLSKLL